MAELKLKWRNRQTRTVQVRVPARAWGFNSPLEHEIPGLTGDFLLEAGAPCTPPTPLGGGQCLRKTHLFPAIGPYMGLSPAVGDFFVKEGLKRGAEEMVKGLVPDHVSRRLRGTRGSSGRILCRNSRPAWATPLVLAAAISDSASGDVESTACRGLIRNCRNRAEYCRKS